MSLAVDDQERAEASMELNSISAAIGALRARMDMRRLRLDQLSAMVGQAKSRVVRQPKAQEFLEKLQEVSHQKSVGLYEELLSAVVQDVLPGPKNVALTLKTSRGLPALDIEMIKPGGERESIMEGSGGALTNILSAGLRIIALARSGAYPFLVLDEPDCWLKPTRVPQFANVLGQIANDLEIQVLLISHHDSDFFAKFSSQIKLEKRGGALEAKWVGVHDPEMWKDAKSGISELRLTHYMSHESTVIPLSPGVTCLTGENDIGKSAIVSALRALFYGDSSDSAISHGASLFNVEAVFHDRSRLSLERYLKKSPKQRWRYYVDGQAEPIQDASPKDGAPDWVEVIAKIAKTEDLDIAFANQKSPVFLLDEPPPRRASILAVGRESAHLQRLIGKNKERNLLDAKLIRDGESEGASIGRELACLTSVDDMGAKAHGFKKDLGSCEKNLADALSLAKSLGELRRLSSLVDGAQSFMSKTALPVPSLKPCDDLRSAAVRWTSASARSMLEMAAQIPEKPVLLGTSLLSSGMLGWSLLATKSRLRSPEPRSFNVELKDIQDLARDMERFREASKKGSIEFDLKSVNPPELSVFESLRSGLAALQRSSKISGLLFEAEERLVSPQPPRLVAMDMAKASVGLVQALEANLAKLEKMDEIRLRKEAEIEHKYTELHSSVNGMCPTCSSPIDPNQLKKGGRAHVLDH